MLPGGRDFYKMSGSGNDFVMVNATVDSAADLMVPSRVRALCARGTGIGADGLVVLGLSGLAELRMTYLNSDGSLADLCGNATLCTAQLATVLGLVGTREFVIETHAGLIKARLTDDRPEIDLQEVRDLRMNLPIRLALGEQWIGFAHTGVPHLVVRVDDVATVDVVGRGGPLRHEQSLANGANVNFVSRDRSGTWSIRTYERGVEGETLACGTGAVATAVLLAASHEIDDAVELTTKSALMLRVAVRERDVGWLPSLSGEARIVFAGRLGDI